MTTQHKALRLADIVGEQRFAELTGNNYGKEAAAELRCLYALNDDLYKQGVALIARISTLEATNQELLEALKLIAEMDISGADARSKSIMADALVWNARAAIAKAEGRA